MLTLQSVDSIAINLCTCSMEVFTLKALLLWQHEDRQLSLIRSHDWSLKPAAQERYQHAINILSQKIIHSHLQVNLRLSSAAPCQLWPYLCQQPPAFHAMWLQVGCSSVAAQNLALMLDMILALHMGQKARRSSPMMSAAHPLQAHCISNLFQSCDQCM